MVHITLNSSSFDEFVADMAPDLVLFDRYLKHAMRAFSGTFWEPHIVYGLVIPLNTQILGKHLQFFGLKFLQKTQSVALFLFYCRTTIFQSS